MLLQSISLIALVVIGTTDASYQPLGYAVAHRAQAKKPHKLKQKPPNNVGAKCSKDSTCYSTTANTVAYCLKKKCAIRYTTPSKTTTPAAVSTTASAVSTSAQATSVTTTTAQASPTVYAFSPAWNGKSTLVQKGNSGVAAMHMIVVGNSHVLFMDKVENNPIKINGNPAWQSYMDVNTLKVTPISAITNSFCASGTWLGNGTLVGVSGSLADASYDKSGLQAVRLFNNCGDSGCTGYENPSRIRLASTRWYPAAQRLQDGSIFVFGGMHYGFNDWNQAVNPTLEYYPPKNIANSMGMPIYSQFLSDALNTNLFPITHLLPDGTIFVAANTLAMIYNWQTNTETRLPNLPNGVIINYPWTAASALLPLRPASNYQPEVWFCGGSAPNTDGDLEGQYYSSQAATSNQCSRMVLTTAGIANGWTIEYAPNPSVMSTAVLTPDGSLLMWGGAKTGLAGYGNVYDQRGSSNADNPIYTPTLYQPNAPAGQRFSQNFPASKIPRMYHSTASLLADGRILIAGSNPNNDVVTGIPYSTEYRTEFFSPPYMTMTRPTFTGIPAKIGYGVNFTLKVKATPGAVFTASLMDLGYSTHSVNYNMRLVELVCTLGSDGTTLTVAGPPTPNLYPPGYGWLYVLANGIPSAGQRVMIGSGQSPPVDQSVINYVIKNSPTNPIKFRPTSIPERR